MPPGVTLKDITHESNLFRTRVIFAYFVVVVLFLGLMLRLVDLQVIEYGYFYTLSHENRVKIVPVAPTRGLIFDRNGVILAQNTPSFSLEVVPDHVADLEAVIDGLREFIDISEADEELFFNRVNKNRGFANVVLRTRLTEQEVARFSVNRHRFPGVDVHARLSRDYPLGSLGVHLIGYVGRISEQELREVDEANYRGTNYHGKTGVEQSYEQILHGKVGYSHVEINAQGRKLRELDRQDPIPGSNLYLGIDASLQAEAEAAFHGQLGSLVALDPGTGDILAFVSMPGYDPNLFVDGIDRESYQELLNSPDRPLFNRALSGQYPPGSTVKPFIGLAGLESGVEQVRKRIWCPGWFSLKGHSHKYRDWKKQGHGRVNLDDAIIESCDVYFYALAQVLGIDRMHDFMSNLGFGKSTGVDLRGEASGLMPSRAWKRQVKDKPWYPGETLITGIGQGFILTTPLQLASVAATLGMRGLRMNPVAGVVLQDPVSNVATVLPNETAVSVAHTDSEHWERIIESMVNVVHGPRGTARNIGLDVTYKIAGKTGTAQVFNIGQEEDYEEGKIDQKLRDHALFIAFAPVDEPRIAVAVVVENGGSGGRTAAPIARRVIDHYLNRGYENERQDGFLLTGISSRE